MGRDAEGRLAEAEVFEIHNARFRCGAGAAPCHEIDTVVQGGAMDTQKAGHLTDIPLCQAMCGFDDPFQRRVSSRLKLVNVLNRPQCQGAVASCSGMPGAASEGGVLRSASRVWHVYDVSAVLGDQSINYIAQFSYVSGKSYRSQRCWASAESMN